MCERWGVCEYHGAVIFFLFLSGNQGHFPVRSHPRGLERRADGGRDEGGVRRELVGADVGAGVRRRVRSVVHAREARVEPVVELQVEHVQVLALGSHE